jgi:hypothetical protein
MRPHKELVVAQAEWSDEEVVYINGVSPRLTLLQYLRGS